jgi:hypothetical protein
MGIEFGGSTMVTISVPMIFCATRELEGKYGLIDLLEVIFSRTFRMGNTLIASCSEIAHIKEF